MKEKTKEERDKDIKEALDFAAERLSNILWEHCVWLQREKRNKSKKTNS